jgi:hypothetical protein
VVDPPALPAHLAGVEGDEAEDGPHRRRLSGAVWAEEPGDGAWLDGERHAVEGAHRPVGANETVDLEHGGEAIRAG